MGNLIELVSKVRRPNLRVRAYETKCNANGEGICEVVVELNHA